MWAKQKKLILAFGGSVLVHLLILVVFGVVIALQPPAKVSHAEKPKPLRLQIVHQDRQPAPPPVAVKRRFVDTAEMAAASPPPNTLAEAAKDTADSSELAPTGTAAVPSQNGRAIPAFMFDTHPKVAAKAAIPATPVATPLPDTAPPLPTPAARAARPAQTPVPGAAPVPRAAPDEFAMLEPTPKPPPPDFDPFVRDPQTEPPRPTPVAAAARAQAARPLTPQEKTLIHGDLSNRGPASIAAQATPQGRYSKAVSDAIRSRWYARISTQMDIASFGTVKIHFFLDRRGKVIEPQVVSNSGNAALASISMQAILDARIPPVPPEVTAGSNSPDLPLDFDFSLY
jgi:outer membrane biosynthesis protein TonB